ncbi:MAG: hypothetical protein EXQ87_08865 [Alphaproteobacteria bacterium]|nr:hypothetical protein [Alphaproteobacteria bacterium]
MQNAQQREAEARPARGGHVRAQRRKALLEMAERFSFGGLEGPVAAGLEPGLGIGEDRSPTGPGTHPAVTWNRIR